ncbi:MAG: protein-L-isoaspartate O-methyltransferase [Geminicoccaceae bacterium]
METAKARINMVQNQLRPNRIDDPAVLEAMGEIPREAFLPKTMASVAYIDEDLPIAGGGNLIEPLAFARMVQAAELKPSDTVLVVGCTTGYCAAVINRLAQAVIDLEPASVEIESVNAVYDRLGIDSIVVIPSEDLSQGLADQAPFDAIFVCGEIAAPSPAWIEQLAEGGRLCAVVANSRVGRVTVFRKSGGHVGSSIIADAAIPPLPLPEKAPAFDF